MDGDNEENRKAFDAATPVDSSPFTVHGLRLKALPNGGELAARSAVEAAFRQLHRRAHEILEHQPFGGTDATILFGQFWVGAGVGDQDGKISLGRRHAAGSGRR